MPDLPEAFLERDIIAYVRGLAEGKGAQLVRGIGDDCAVIRHGGGKVLLLTTDMLTESVHFDLAWHPAAALGRKAASVNISDVAAMGGRPLVALLSLAVPAGLQAAFLNDFLAGFTARLAEYDTLLVGGDTVASPDRLTISVTVVGEASEAQVLYRTGAGPGDLIWVSGSLGAAAAGLDLCRLQKAGRAIAMEGYHGLLAAHLDPEPQVQLGLMLAASGLVGAMLDVSDGLATDLAHLCKESGVGAEVFVEQLPIPSPVRELAASLNRSALDWAVRGGEDYQLLFTSPAECEHELRRLVAERSGRHICCIGKVVTGDGVFLCQSGTEGMSRRPIAYQGFDHFSGRD